jgi:hypothetical protein
MIRYTRLIRSRAVVLVLALLQLYAPLCAQRLPANRNANQNKDFKIAGTIVSSLTGMPLAQARVSLIDTENRASALWMITSESGRFEFSPLKRGKFSLQGVKRGFIPAAYEQHEQFSTAIVTGAGLDTENLVLRITPLALLSGKVIDEAGEPVRNAGVTLYAENHRAGVNRISLRADASTDDQGSFEFAALGPGNYYLGVAAKPWYAVHPVSITTERAGNSPPGVAASLDVAYPTTYYGGATESEGAIPIPIKGGDHSQVEIHLNPVPALHILYHVSNDGQEGWRTPVLQKRVFSTEEDVQNEGAQCVTPGICELLGVPAGRYSVQIQEPKSGQIEQSAEIDLNQQNQELDTGHSEATAKVKLSVKMPRQEPLPKELYLGLQNSRRQTFGYQQVETTGEATFENVVAGKYAIRLFFPEKAYSVVRTSSKGVEISGPDLEVTPGASLDVTVQLVEGVVTVEGFTKKGDKPSAGVMVALVPNDPEAHLDMFRRDQSDLDGSFILRDVIPGTYTIVAAEDAWGFPWLQPGVLKRYVEHGQNLTIGELMKGSVLLPDPVEVQPR